MLQFSSDFSETFFQDLKACQRKLVNGSRTFLAASRLLPKRVRYPAIALYAFCREADDAIDLARVQVDNLRMLSERLEKIYMGYPDNNPTDRAFSEVVHTFLIPRALLDALIEGFMWDAQERRYKTYSDVLAYATRVAGSVGTMMALLMGVRSQRVLERACDLGIAMQLSNIARDVGEDARAGRIYLPLDWMRSVDLNPDLWLKSPQPSPALTKVIERLLKAAEQLYHQASIGISDLRWDCRAGIYTAALLYQEIGNQVRRNHHDSVSQRAVVSPLQKVRVAARAGIMTLRPLAAPLAAETLKRITPVKEAQYLVQAIPAHAPEPQQTKQLPWWNIPARIIKVLEIFERLEKEEWQARQERFNLAKPSLSVSTARA